MRTYLLKKGKTKDDFLFLEVDNHLLRKTEGKVGLKATKKVTHCGTFDEALKIFNETTIYYKSKGYFEEEIPREVTEPIVFDNAEWHYDGDFPSDLSQNQAYIHTGFYVGWLLKKNFFNEIFEKENHSGITYFYENKITAVDFFKDYMGGILMSDFLNENGIEFTKYYFGLDFAKSKYISDFIEAFCEDLPTVYHVKDTKANYTKIQKIIESNYNNWVAQLN